MILLKKILRLAKKAVCNFFYFLGIPLFLIVAGLVALYARQFGQDSNTKPRLVWGPHAIINNSYWSKAMQEAGFDSITYTNDVSYRINKRADYDRVLQDEYPWASMRVAQLLAFLESLIKYDYFFISFNGYFLADTLFEKLEGLFFRIAGKKVVVIPYGSDAYVIRNVKSKALQHALLKSWPFLGRQQGRNLKRVEYWCRNGDVVIPGLMGPEGFGRWDVLTPNPLCIDLDKWQSSRRDNNSDGRMGTVTIAHAPTHRGFKGTEFVIQAIEILKSRGYNINFKLIEGVQNLEVKRILAQETDILLEQLICPGHGLNALEGMASGLPVVCNLEDDDFLLPFRRWSFFRECPLVSASPETVTDILEKLIIQPELRHKLGKAGRAYVKKYHGYDSSRYLFGSVIKKLEGEDIDLMNLYHPIHSEYNNRLPTIDHPLEKNKIPQ